MNLHSKVIEKLLPLCSPAIVNIIWSFDSKDKGEQPFGQKGFMLHKRRLCGYVDFNHSFAHSQVAQSDLPFVVSSTDKLRSGGIPKAFHIEHSTVQDDTGRLGSFVECFLFF